MRTAVDSSVILPILKGECGAGHWLDLLIACRQAGVLLVCEVTVAEISGRLNAPSQVERVLNSLELTFDPLSLESAQLAGHHFATYRRQGGPRQQLIPDFLIGAHAQVQADQLIAQDRGYLRRYFGELTLVTPESR